jgi:predicted nuclease of restriction endonuclease-like (RecB) superfamily
MRRLLSDPARKSPTPSAAGQAVEFIKDPYVLEFLGMPETPCETPPHFAIAQEGRAR